MIVGADLLDLSLKFEQRILCQTVTDIFCCAFVWVYLVCPHAHIRRLAGMFRWVTFGFCLNRFATVLVHAAAHRLGRENPYIVTGRTYLKSVGLWHLLKLKCGRNA